MTAGFFVNFQTSASGMVVLDIPCFDQQEVGQPAADGIAQHTCAERQGCIGTHLQQGEPTVRYQIGWQWERPKLISQLRLPLSWGILSDTR